MKWNGFKWNSNGMSCIVSTKWISLFKYFACNFLSLSELKAFFSLGLYPLSNDITAIFQQLLPFDQNPLNYSHIIWNGFNSFWDVSNVVKSTKLLTNWVFFMHPTNSRLKQHFHLIRCHRLRARICTCFIFRSLDQKHKKKNIHDNSAVTVWIVSRLSVFVCLVACVISMN